MSALLFHKWFNGKGNRAFLHFSACMMIINNKITLEWEQKQLIMCVHTLSYFLHDVIEPLMMIKYELHVSTPNPTCSAYVQPMTSELTTECIMIVTQTKWKVISNSIDIDLIHDDIRNRVQHYIYHWLIEAKWCIYVSVNLPSLVQTIACRLAGAKPLSELILEYH